MWRGVFGGSFGGYKLDCHYQLGPLGFSRNRWVGGRLACRPSTHTSCLRIRGYPFADDQGRWRTRMARARNVRVDCAVRTGGRLAPPEIYPIAGTPGIE